MSGGDLIVLSHLRWTFVWQRPQHVVSRLARNQRTWFVEEPQAGAVSRPRLRSEEHGLVRRVWLEVPGEDRHYHFGEAAAADYGTLLRDVIGSAVERTVWLYTPMALEVAYELEPTTLVYDVMDDLASFKGAPPALRRRQREALVSADVVFSGGRSLHRMVSEHRGDGAYLFPSGVEPAHYACAPRRRGQHARPVAGYVGVIDERIDLGLLAEMAERLPGWDVHMVGPVVKIDPATLPAAPNLSYFGPQPYERLPQVMAGFDVALMPFALNQATRAISPTKTLEYLAAGLPVVSTRVPDVVADFTDVVELADDAAGFAQACGRALEIRPDGQRQQRVKALLRWHHWDAITDRMQHIVATSQTRATRQEAPA